MTRLIKFNREGQPIADWLNASAIRIIDFDDARAVIQLANDFSATVTVEEANRIIAEINYDLVMPSVRREDLDFVAEQILKGESRPGSPATVPPIAPAQPAVTLDSFKAMIRRNDFVVLDTETTGLDDGEIVQIAILDSTGMTLLDTLVKPKQRIPADATKIHGITDDMVKDAPTWETVRGQVYSFLSRRHVVIYNAVYDRKMMHKTAERWGLPKTEWKEIAAFWCAMEAFAEQFGEWNDYRQSYKWQRLDKAANYYNVTIDGTAHTALTDCKTTLAVCKAMAGV